MTNILLCGGSGLRLWPLSREQYPKQFCRLIGSHTLYQESLLRNLSFCKKTIVVTNEALYPLAKKQADELNIKNIEFILEPVGRNTAPAIALACMAVNDNDVVFITPSDHYIKDEENYRVVFKKLNMLAENNFLVTIGIKPSMPETGYGYIQSDGENVFSFHEKPNAETAVKYLEEGNYFWNSGMFAFRAGVFLDELRLYAGEIYDAALHAYTNSKNEKGIIKIPTAFMERIPAISIDYAVMEKSRKIKMVSSNMNWSDLGGFEAIYTVSQHDENGNASSSDNVFLNSANNLVVSEKTVVCIDIDDLIIIDTSDALLISRKGSSHKIKEIIPKIKKYISGTET